MTHYNGGQHIVSVFVLYPTNTLSRVLLSQGHYNDKNTFLNKADYKIPIFLVPLAAANLVLSIL